MDQIELGRWFGRMEATLEDHGRRLSKLEERRPRSPLNVMALLPYLYAAGIISLAVAGKMTLAEAIQALKGGG